MTPRAHTNAQVEKDAATETFSTWGGEVVAEAAFRIREAQSAFDPKSAIKWATSDCQVRPSYLHLLVSFDI